ncbi:MAG: branched-chain amino acid transporter permease [Bacillota bacterium]|nr:branched-chain amino acid transporter permease [Bacillota bacterium]
MSNSQLILTVLLIMGVTMLTRFLSFLVFPAGKETPAFIRYLGKVLPAAAMAMLVVYCYKGIDLTAGNHGAPELIAGLAVAAMHRWKHSMLLSIGGGTALYLVLIHLVF